MEIATGYVMIELGRYVNDIVNRAPDRVVIATGFEDSFQTLSSVVSAETIWDGIPASNPYVDLLIVGPWPNAGSSTTITPDLEAMDVALEEKTAERTLPYISLISDGLTFARADVTHPDAEAHKKIGMYLAGRIAQLAVPAVSI